MSKSTWLIVFALMFSVFRGALAQDHYAVLIGVETYDTSTFNNLKFAGDDAVALSMQLERLGFKTTTMTSESESARLRPTTPKKIIDVIEAVGRSCAKDDTLVIALSGHGVQFSDEVLLPTGVRETYFCPSDASLGDKSTLLRISSIVDAMNQTKASRKLLLVDACQEQKFSSEGEKKGGKLIDLGSIHESRLTVPGGMAILFSCSDNQFSWEHPPLGHSVFTYHVIEYLRGSAQARYYDEGKIELNGLVSYVAKNTNDYVIQKRLTSDGQLPVLRGNTSNWILGDPPTNPPSIPLPIHNATGETISNSIGMQLTLVRKGTFLMGAPPHERFVGRRFLGVRPDEEDSNDDERQHIVTISKDFYLGIYEVTQAEYQTIMGKNPSRFQGDVIAERDPNTGQVVRRVSSSLYPVEQVSWNDAVEFCKKLSELPNERAAGLVYRLPTEAEWEYACRAESKTSFCFGDNYDNRLSEYAWFSSPKTHKYTRPVATKKPNPWGLYDMHGNVWEWCSDWYGDYPTSAVVDPVGPATGLTRVCRGGSFVNPQEECRSACRGGEGSLPHDTPFDLGFRVALSSTGIPQSPEADK